MHDKHKHLPIKLLCPEEQGKAAKLSSSPTNLVPFCLLLLQTCPGMHQPSQ